MWTILAGLAVVLYLGSGLTLGISVLFFAKREGAKRPLTKAQRRSIYMWTPINILLWPAVLAAGWLASQD